MRYLLFALLLLPGLAFGSNVVIFDPNDPDVQNRVTRFRRSVPTGQFASRTDVLINPDVSALQGVVPVRHWKVSLPSTVLEMTQAEKDLIDADNILAAQRAAQLRTRLDTLFQRLTDWDTMTDAQRFAAMKVMLQWLRLRDQVGEAGGANP